jgi:hypothetical protein
MVSYKLTSFQVYARDPAFHQLRIVFSIERTAVWFLGCDSEVMFCLLLWPLRVGFGHFIFHLALGGTQTDAVASVCQWATKVQTGCSCPPLEFANFFHRRVPEVVKMVLWQSSVMILWPSSHFFYAVCGRMTQILTVLKWIFSMFDSRKSFRSVFFP